MSSNRSQIKDTKRRNILQQLQLILESIESESECGRENGPKNVVETQVVCVPLGGTAPPLSEQYNPFSTDSEQRLKFEAIQKRGLPQIYQDNTSEVQYTTSDKITQDSSDMRNYEYLPDFEHEHEKQNYRDTELRGGILHKGCDFVKRNGLQHHCLRTECPEQTRLNARQLDCIPSGIQGSIPRPRKQPATNPARHLGSPKTPKQHDRICHAELPCIICDPPIKSQKIKHEVNQTYCKSSSYLNKPKAVYDKRQKCCCSYKSWSKPIINECPRHEPQRSQYAPRVDWAKVDRSVPPECQLPRQPSCLKTYGKLCTAHDRKPCFEVYCRYCKIHEPKTIEPVRRFTNLDYFQQW